MLRQWEPSPLKSFLRYGLVPVTMHVKGLTPASMTADDGIVHGHLSNFEKRPSNTIFPPSLKFAHLKKSSIKSKIEIN